MRAAIFLLALAMLLAGCGYRGPLYLPKSKPEAQKPVPKPVPSPAAQAGEQRSDDTPRKE